MKHPPSAVGPRLAALAAALFGVLFAASLPGCRSTTAPAGRIADAREAEGHLDDAEKLLDEGLEEEALAALRLALEDDPLLVNAHLEEAKIHRGRGDNEAALSAYQRAGEIDPDNYDAAYGGALMQHLAGRLRDAVDGYLNAIRLQPASFDAARDLGAAYLQLGQPDAALAPAERATRLDPGSQPAWSNLAVAQGMLGDWEGAIGSYRRAAELGSLDDPMLLGLANAHIQLRNFERAVNVLASAQRRRPTLRGHERLGYAHFKMGRHDEALAAYEAALREDPTDVPALNGLAVTHLTLHHKRPGPNPYHRVMGVSTLRASIAQRPQQPRMVDLLSRYE